MVDVLKEYHSNILDQRSATQKTVDEALEVVREFIIGRRRVMVGGMMMDMALKLKGDLIYGPDVLPDYDFYSPNHYRDAYDLSEILCKKNFRHISVIPARHVTTMRVRVNFEVVADITYCPQLLYDSLPTIKYDKFIIRHPHVQMIDQHIALSNPFANPGQEVIFERWKKDCTRYDKLYKHYSIEKPDSAVMPSQKHAFHSVTVPSDMLEGNCLGGWAAFHVWVEKSKNLGKPIRSIRTVSMPKWAPVTILTDDIGKYATAKGAKFYNQYFDHIMRRVVFTKNGVHYEMMDTHGLKIGSHDGVVNLQYVMVYILSQFVYNPDDENVCVYARHCYNVCREMIEAAYDLPPEHQKTFLPTVEVYGATTISPSIQIYKNAFMSRIEKKKAVQVAPRSAFPKHPECIVDQTFDISSSEHFRIDGKEIESFV